MQKLLLAFPFSTGYSIKGFSFPILLTCWPPVDIYGAVLAEAVRQGVERDFDLVLCDTSGRKYLHTSG